LYENLAGPGADWGTVRSLAEIHADIAGTLVDLGARVGTPAAQRQGLRNRAAGEYRKARELYEGLRARGVLPAVQVKRIGELRAEEDKLRRAP
jgi:hypothetical protein